MSTVSQSPDDTLDDLRRALRSGVGAHVALDHLLLPAVLIDRSLHVLAANPACSDLLGGDLDDLIGTGFPELAHPEDVVLDVELAQQLFAGEISSYRVEKRLVTRRGELRWVDLVLSATDDEPPRALALLLDVTDRKRIEIDRDANQDEADALIGQLVERHSSLTFFVARAAHELRLPANHLGLGTSVLGRLRDDLDETRRDLISDLQESANRLVELSDRLLDFTQIHADDSGPELRPVPLHDVVIRAIEVVPRSEGVDVVNDVRGPLVASADPLWVQQILVNLLSNAGRHARREVRVECSSEGSSLSLAVTDDGDGLSDEQASRLFEPFASGAVGAGLGLAIAQGYAREMGSRIDYERADGRTRFSLHLERE